MNTLTPRSEGAPPDYWVVGPQPIVVRAYDPWHSYRLELRSRRGVVVPAEAPPAGADETPPPVRLALDRRARLILAVKFLSAAEPGVAIAGNREVARIANGLLVPGERTVDETTVANLVHRRRRDLEQRGVRGLDSPDALGRQLIAWGVLDPADRTLLRPPVEPSVPAVRLAGVGDLGHVVDVLGRLVLVDPRLPHVLAGAEQRSDALRALVRLLVEPVVARGTCWSVAGCGAALWLPPEGLGPEGTTRLLDGVRQQLGTQCYVAATRLLGVTRGRAVGYRLLALGVVPERRGRGVGRALMDAASARFDRDGAPASADVAVGDTATESARELLEGAGFVVQGRADRMPGGPSLERLWREGAR